MAFQSLENQFISASFGQLVQTSGSEFADGLGNNLSGSEFIITASNAISASHAVQADNADFAISASHAEVSSLADNATTASFAQTASLAALSTTASFAQTASFLLGSIESASFADNATSASFATTASFALNVVPIDTGSFFTDATSDFSDLTFTKGDGTTLEVDATPRQLIETVKNGESGTLIKGTPVYASGSQGNASIVYAASASRADRMPAAYVLNEDLNADQEGEALLAGFINGVNTSAFNAGDVVYVGASGGYTNVKPTGSSIFIQNLGKTIKIDGLNGSGVISGAGRANDVPNIAENHLWVGNSDGVATPTDKDALTVGTASLALDVISTANLNINTISASNATFASASIGFLESVTGSAKIIGDAFIILNNDLPTERYAGLVVQDSGSGSPLTTASFQWDGQTQDWFLEYSDDGGATTEHGIALFGPEYTTIGSPTYNTNNRLVKGNGGHHLNDSTITDDGTKVSTTVPFEATQITASVGFNGNLAGNAATATSASFADNATSASFADNATSASFADNATSSSYALSASHAEIADEATTLVDSATVHNLQINGYVANEVEAVTVTSNTASLDLTNYNTFFVDAGTGTKNISIDASTAPRVGAVYNILLKQGASGTSTITGYSSEFKFPAGTPPTFTLEANDMNLLSAVCFESNIVLATGLADFS